MNCSGKPNNRSFTPDGTPVSATAVESVWLWKDDDENIIAIKHQKITH